MKILMFCCEFPPHISGGRGTACFGLTKSLVNADLSPYSSSDVLSVSASISKWNYQFSPVSDQAAKKVNTLYHELTT